MKAPQGVADYLTGRVRLVRSKCTTCIFWPGNRMHLVAGRVKDMCETSAEKEGAITCHQTLAYGYEDLPEGACNGHTTSARWAQQIRALRWAQETGLATWVDTERGWLTYQQEGQPVDPANPADRWLTGKEATIESASLGIRNLPHRAAPVPTSHLSDPQYGWTVYLGPAADAYYQRRPRDRRHLPTTI